MRKPKLFVLLVFLVASTSTGCLNLQLSDLDGILNGQAPLTESTVADGLKEALRVGTDRTS
ncbi:MAG: DUF4197 domain-containing protein, partial [Bacteroidetes Order II. Incertae sedis bacterium]|nr:DUF4197 domain-containing protein [Bacteroidetes Order II. bacterium]